MTTLEMQYKAANEQLEKALEVRDWQIRRLKRWHDKFSTVIGEYEAGNITPPDAAIKTARGFLNKCDAILHPGGVVE